MSAKQFSLCDGHFYIFSAWKRVYSNSQIEIAIGQKRKTLKNSGTTISATYSTKKQSEFLLIEVDEEVVGVRNIVWPLGSEASTLLEYFAIAYCIVFSE